MKSSMVSLSGRWSWKSVHLNIEKKRLTMLVGDAGKRLHTGRSRNDQVATDIRLFLRDAIDELRELIQGLQNALLDLARTTYSHHHARLTHLQVAQPISFAHHLNGVFEMLKRDAERLQDCRKRVNRLPLGAAALAGTSYPIKREYVAELLSFDGVCENSLDAVSDREFRHRIHRRRRADHDPFIALVRRTELLWESMLRFHRHCRSILYRFIHHAAEKKS